MAWSTPPTFVSGQVITASFLNALRDNLNQTAPAKATASGRTFASSGVNTIAERVPTADYIATSQTTTSTSFANLATVGPTVTVTTGTQALVVYTCALSNNTLGQVALMSAAISGASTFSAADQEGIYHTSATASAAVQASWAYIYPLTAGSNVWTAKYRVNANTGAFQDRRISVLPF